jgi:alpha-ribazole phosphatase
MKTFKIHLIRHGITQGNLDGRYIGISDIPLCSEGIEELESLKECFEYPYVQKTYSSPLIRCVETAKIIHPDTFIETVDDLIEYNFGEFEGKSIDELKHNQRYIEWFNGGMMSTPDGGDIKSDFDARCDRGFLYVLKDMMKNDITNACLVAHGGVIMSLLARHGLPQRPASEWFVANGRGYIVNCTAQLWGMGEAFEVFNAIPLGDEDTHNAKGYEFINIQNDEEQC